MTRAIPFTKARLRRAIVRGADHRADFMSQNAPRNSGAGIVLRDGDDVGSRSV
jgi:hypothetical protein